ncbi:alpha-D-xyloside xylohydrolase [Amycolatopsis bartoniae]|uniref:Family 31 glucosidase n=1 Tax=Amycolatopsis bartoniae TaxID=941986 RepID=A0A8H9IXM0_9PSEU|nr:TIM-barrel domain-containing protein [Amycolatopsis bartoniae]MBB2940069.1 alpha-D-xyloside xylohydrolase [Amycolatopsis bartoniae]TVT09451.1 family 31 glucosidase [Amycolatopsis bartoniae]GHF53737.1 family 31 glucosidase [Amycolatopsis bartoniae]
MITIREDGRVLEVTVQHEVLRVEPWGPDSVRVRAGQHTILDDVPGALVPPKPTDVTVTTEEREGRLVNGGLTAIVEIAESDTGDSALLRFVRTCSGEELLAEERAHFWWPGARLFSATGNGYARLEQRFAAYEGERLYGLGQHTHGRLDQKGLVLDLVQRNAEVSIPFLLSSRGYGFLWNLPAVGRVELAENGTRWVADSARQIDYWVTAAATPAGILSRYADATGHAPMLPEWAAGFWQSKLRYRTQEELLAVAREHKRRGLPLSVIVTDFFHWTHLGDWRFDPAEWPDPDAMIAELDELGVKLMVSVWPSVSPLSENYPHLLNEGLLAGTEQGVPFHAPWKDKGFDTKLPVAFYDPTNPAAREFLWRTVKRNYYDKGVRVWWLDACEPEIQPGHPQNLRFHAGPGSEVFNLYPMAHARAFAEGLHGEGDDEVVLLCRSAWAGSQRYGAALWSGDIPATWESLRAQVRAGLNVALSGIPWWTTDIGGFHGGDPGSPEYRELMVRWFQYGVFCPLFRLHGYRDPRTPFGPEMEGGPNEVWSYGEEAYELIANCLRLRERLRPYLMTQLRAAHEQGLPPLRPVFLQFPADARAWEVDDEFLLGPDILVAPVLAPGATAREVYLPAGAEWVDAWTGTTHGGGETVSVPVVREHIPVFLRAGADVRLR